MAFNPAFYAANLAYANERDARHIELDAAGQPVNLNPHGQPFHGATVRAAQERQSFNVYRDAMTFLDSVIGDETDTKTRKAFDQASGKFTSVGHAEQMRDKLVIAALNGSNAALIAYAAACIYLHPYAGVDFSWYVNGEEELTITVDDEGYYAATKTVSATVSVAFPHADTAADFEGFAVTYRVATPTPRATIPTPTTPNPVTLVPAGPAYVKEARAMIDGADKQEVMSAVIHKFVMGMARRDLGDQFKTAQFMAKALEDLSAHAQAGNYEKLIEKGTFFDLWARYEETTALIGELYMKVLAPNALSYHAFIDACSQATVSATISPTCPACNLRSLEFCTDFIIDTPLKNVVSVVCECSKCGFSPTLDIQIVKPADENEQLIRSYIRSLLVFEEYRPNGGPIIDRRMAERVSAQAYKAMAHLPNGLTYDYDKAVREEMAKYTA